MGGSVNGWPFPLKEGQEVKNAYKSEIRQGDSGMNDFKNDDKND